MGTVEFKGKIDQAAAGDLINEAPQISNNNVLNLHLTSQVNEQRLPGEYLTSQQKAGLGKLVQKIVATKGVASLDVWNDILARAGAKKVKFIDKDQYVDLNDYLRKWLDEGKEFIKPPLINPIQLAPKPAAPAHHRLSEHGPTGPCAHCAIAQKTISITRKKMWAAFAMAGISAVGMIYFATKAFALTAPAPATATQMTVCEFDGKFYAVGSVLNSKGECVATSGFSPQWKPSESSVQPSKKISHQKSRPHQNKPAAIESDADVSAAAEN